MNNELKTALDNLETKLKDASVEDIKHEVQEVKSQIDSEIVTKMEDLSTKFGKDLQDGVAEIKRLEDLTTTQQEHLDKLDMRLKAKAVGLEMNIDPIQDMIQKGYDQIKEVARKSKVTLESKAVGDMTLSASLTGDQPRTYSQTVATLPNQILNFADLVGVVNIGNGTYTFPRRTTSEGSVSTQTEGNAKSQVDYDLSMIDVNTDFIAGFAVYSRKMANNLPFLESFLPPELRRSYFDAENSAFNTILATGTTGSTASSQTITGQNKIEMLMNEVATLEGSNWGTDGIVMTPADYWAILMTEKSTGAGYGVPAIITLDGGQLRCNGIPLYRANFLATNKYYVGNWFNVKKIVTEGLSVQFSTEDSDNFQKNNITARIEAQVGLASHRPDSMIYGDFTAT